MYRTIFNGLILTFSLSAMAAELVEFQAGTPAIAEDVNTNFSSTATGGNAIGINIAYSGKFKLWDLKALQPSQPIAKTLVR